MKNKKSSVPLSIGLFKRQVAGQTVEELTVLRDSLLLAYSHMDYDSPELSGKLLVVTQLLDQKEKKEGLQ